MKSAILTDTELNTTNAWKNEPHSKEGLHGEHKHDRVESGTNDERQLRPSDRSTRAAGRGSASGEAGSAHGYNTSRACIRASAGGSVANERAGGTSGEFESGRDEAG